MIPISQLKVFIAGLLKSMKHCDELPLLMLGAKPFRYKERPVGT